MKKMLLISLGLLVLAGAAFAGNNAGAMAYLSWSSGNHTTTNAVSAATNTLYVRLERATAMDFKGAEFDLIWSPVTSFDNVGCYTRLGTFFTTSSSCTTSGYLNRGSSVPVTTIDDPNHYHVAWASDLVSACTMGNACRVQFETDLCASDWGYADNSGCFTMTFIKVLDSNVLEDILQIPGPQATIDNGTQYCATPVQPTTWGNIKGLYNH